MNKPKSTKAVHKKTSMPTVEHDPEVDALLEQAAEHFGTPQGGELLERVNARRTLRS